MKKIIVTTTINPITPAIEKYQAMEDWELIVVGDKKTPPYPLTRGTYLSPDMQEAINKPLSDAIGWHCIQRRNMGFVYAYQQGADIVATVDDDNIPMPHWGKTLFINKETSITQYDTTLAAFDPVGATNAFPIWHRGYPLSLLSQRDYSQSRTHSITPDIQANLWQGDPDTDAICRMIYDPQCTCESSAFPFSSNTVAPFNSQNTFISRDWLKHYFMFPGIGRMDDIWAAYYVQALGANIIFGEPSVTHARNVHDHQKDFELEIVGHQKTLALIMDLANDPNAIKHYLPEQTLKAFELYQACFN